jgi:hypothetical protein
MSLGKVAVLAIALVFVSGGIGAALADWENPAPAPAIDLADVDARKDDAVDDTALVEVEDDDPDGSGAGGPQSLAPPDGGAADAADATVGDGGTAVEEDAVTPAQFAPAAPPIVLGDGDATAGNDGTAGGNNTAAATPAAGAGIGVGAAAGDDSVAGGNAGGDTG